MIQKEIESGSATGHIEAGFVAHGDLVPTAIVIDAILDAIKAAPTDIVLIDGFPRKEKQLNEFCDIVFNSNELEVIAAIEVRVSEATAKERFLAAGHSEEVFVITSYSIHYTKLYELQVNAYIPLGLYKMAALYSL